MKHFNQKETMPFKFLDAIEALTDEQIKDLIQKAKNLGIPQDQINKGLELIKQIKQKNN